MLELAEFTPATLAELEHLFPPELDHLSASGLKMFLRCPEQFRRRYIMGERIPPAAALIWGRADHETIEWNLKTKLETGYDQPVPAVQEMFVHKVEQEIESEGGLDGLEWKKGTGIRAKRKEVATMKDRGAPLVAEYRREVCVGLEPVALEEAFSLDLTGAGVPVRVDGRIDLEVYNVDPFTRERLAKKPHIRERKTTGVRKSEPEQEWVFQSRVYQLHKKVPVQIDLSVKNKTPVVIAGEKKFLVRPWPAYKTEAMIAQLCDVIGFLYAKYGPEAAWPGAFAHPFACGYCGYAKMCTWQTR